MHYEVCSFPYNASCFRFKLLSVVVDTITEQQSMSDNANVYTNHFQRTAFYNSHTSSHLRLIAPISPRLIGKTGRTHNTVATMTTVPF